MVEATGKINDEDYRRLVPQLEHVIETAGSLRLMVRLLDFHGWTPKGLLEDLRFDMKHHGHFQRVAIVGEKATERVGTTLSKPFFSGDMRFFEDEPSAEAWLDEAA